MKLLVCFLVLSTALSSCFKSVTTSLGSTARLAPVTTETVTGKTLSTITSTSTESVTVAATSLSALAGTSVNISPDTFSMSSALVIESGVLLSETSVQSEVALASDIQVQSASAGVVIRPSEVVELKKPLSISLPLPTATGLYLASPNYAVYFKYLDPSTEKLVTGLLQVDAVNTVIRFDEVTSKDVIQFSGYFGSYWVVSLSRPLVTAELPPKRETTEPIINKNLTTVIATSGIVTEKAVSVAEAIPPLTILKPELSFDLLKREVTGKITSDKRLKACSIDLFQSASDLNGLSREVATQFSYSQAITKSAAHALVARFRCSDENQKTVISPWSDALQIPEYTFTSLDSIGSSLSNGLYGLGSDIPLLLTFNDTVTVTGIPALALNSGANAGVAVYQSGSGSKTLAFAYKVVAADDAADLDYKGVDALTLPAGASIKDSRGFDVNLVLPALDSAKSLASAKDIAIDGVAPSDPSSIGFASPYSSTLSFNVAWNVSSDRNLLTHNIKLCAASDCSTTCLTPVTSFRCPLSSRD